MAKTQDVALFFGGTLINQVVMFGSGLFVARWLGPDGYGVLSLVRNVYALAAILAPLGLDLSLLRHLGENAGDWPRSIAQISRFRMLAAVTNLVLAAAAAVLLGPWIQTHVYARPHFALYLGLAFAALPFAADVGILTAALRALDRVAFQNLAALYLQPLARVAALVLFFSLGFGVAGVVASTAVGMAASCLAMSFGFAKVVRERGITRHGVDADDYKTIRRVMGYSAWMAAMMFAYNILRSIDILVLGWFRPAAQVGEYAALSTIAYMIQIFPLAISQTLGPQIARLYAAGDMAGMRRELSGYFRRGVLLTSPLFAGLAAFGPWLDLLFGTRYHFSDSLAFNLSLAYLICGCLAPMGVSLTMTGRHRLEFVVLIGGTLAALGLCVLLAPRFGGNGVAVSITIGYLLINGIRTVLSARFMGGIDMSFGDLLPPALCLALAMGWRRVLDAFAPHNLVTAIWGATVLIAAFAVLYTLVLLRPDEKAFVAARAPWRRLGQNKA